MEKTYDPKAIEKQIYDRWLSKKYFNPQANSEKESYTISLPPPNITGRLHVGHALNGTIQDILIRYKRMQGYNTLWVPGTDHASISTELKLLEQLKEEGLDKSDITREEFLERAWTWKDEYGGIITTQYKMLGVSCDWDRERFTMDEGLSKAVEEVFIRLYEKGYIYKGERLVNWCPKCKTSISDAEVDHVQNDGVLYHMQYNIIGTKNMLTFATTRPETILGDTAIAVHPTDDRYKEFIGKKVLVPIVNREIEIIADTYVDMEYGSGVVKITPAHDFNDYEIAIRHNLQLINMLNDNATINQIGLEFEGLTIKEAREKIIDVFKELNQFVKEEKIQNSISRHDTCKTIIEPLLKEQWFVKMSQMAQPAIDAYKSGELRFVPDRFAKIYLNWMENIKDWCISRQLWWGHSIPAYYCKDCDNIMVKKQCPTECTKCSSKDIIQDEDTLDTWFSSALWPFSTLGWPEQTEDLKAFYPTNVLVTGFDIIFFWVARMVFSSQEHLGVLPFKDVLINGIVRDALGRKMSKSLGNGIDPMEIINNYGADALRLTLIMGSAMGQDQRFSMEKLEGNRNFLNKVYNAARFILMNDEKDLHFDEKDLQLEDKWIRSKLNSLSKEVTNNLEQYDLGQAIQKIYDFIWVKYCDWYIEMVKPRLYDKDSKTRAAAIFTLKDVLAKGLKLMHPFAPFITEEIFLNLQNEDETIVFAKWPEYNACSIFEEEEKFIDIAQEAIKSIRNIRANMNVMPSKKTKIILVTQDEKLKSIVEQTAHFIKSLASASEIIIQKNEEGIGKNAVPVVVTGGVIYIPFEELINIEEELKRLTRESEKLMAEVARIDNMLDNKGFVEKAPKEKIDQEKLKRQNYEQKLIEVKKSIEKLKG